MYRQGAGPARPDAGRGAKAVTAKALQAKDVTDGGGMGARIALAGVAFLADPSGALFDPAAGLMLVADLHLEKGSAFAARAALLPPYDTRATLLRLAGAAERLRPRAIAALGDSFHDRRGPARLADDDRRLLAELQRGRDWLWITGNHDPQLPEWLGGEVHAEARHGPLTLRHVPGTAADDGAWIAGHLHPAARLRLRGRTLRRRCFVSDGRRCVLPAFGAYAGGLNVRDPAFRPLFPQGMEVRLAGERRVFAAPVAMLAPD